MHKKTITFFCSSKNTINIKYMNETEKLVSNININKYKICFGGGSTGLMGIIRKSWIGELITSNINRFIEPEYKDDYIYDNLHDRQKKLIELGDIFIILPGGYGTLFEMLEVITKNDIGETNKPIYILNIDGFYDIFMEHLKYLINNNFSKELNKINVNFINSVEQLLLLLNNDI